MDAIDLSLFVSRMASACEEMGAVLKRAALSPNIKDRLDFSCAVFDRHGRLCAQAAHIPVHLGSMAYAMSAIVSRFEWGEGDVVVLNDPFLGGTHLPDVTVVAPIMHDGCLVGFVANRAHHANIGSPSPGSMPLSTTLEEEGLVIEPVKLFDGGQLVPAVAERLQTLESGAPGQQLPGDFWAQVSAARTGLHRLGTLIETRGPDAFLDGLAAMNDYAARVSDKVLRQLPEGIWSFTDSMDSDGAGAEDIPIQVTLTVADGRLHFDFAGTAAQVAGNINCPLSVTAAAVYYVVRCLLPPQVPDCAGAFASVALEAPEGTLVNATGPAAVAAGNVETSSRLVDVILGVLAQVIPARIPAAAQGTMNNVAMGSRVSGQCWDYYETIAGGTGGHQESAGLDAVQSHMTNTLNTPIESLERHYPLRVLSYAVRRQSGGAGRHPGGNGVVREYEFLGPADVTLLTERRRRGPWGLANGAAGQPGINRLNEARVGEKARFKVAPGDRLSIETPGGGGWGTKTKYNGQD
ncbi:hydantoinase B/oxoprolinase family protein [Marinobacteraceae bacterium S3BR75-40.1]